MPQDAGEERRAMVGMRRDLLIFILLCQPFGKIGISVSYRVCLGTSVVVVAYTIMDRFTVFRFISIWSVLNVRRLPQSPIKRNEMYAQNCVSGNLTLTARL